MRTEVGPGSSLIDDYRAVTLSHVTTSNLTNPTKCPIHRNQLNLGTLQVMDQPYGRAKPRSSLPALVTSPAPTMVAKGQRVMPVPCRSSTAAAGREGDLEARQQPGNSSGASLDAGLGASPIVLPRSRMSCPGSSMAHEGILSSPASVVIMGSGLGIASQCCLSPTAGTDGGSDSTDLPGSCGRGDGVAAPAADAMPILGGKGEASLLGPRLGAILRHWEDNVGYGQPAARRVKDPFHRNSTFI